MVLDESALEQRLVLLGGEELAIEQKIHKLKALGREAALKGQHEQADAIWDLVETLKSELSSLQSELMQVERDLYALRKRRR